MRGNVAIALAVQELTALLSSRLIAGSGLNYLFIWFAITEASVKS